ncbi:MAG TPA: hypothetical protein DDY68_00115 [Porphyromonadaceae bacterium]|nr:hypothetical protein [Porphyromonadaceae bacterium]
MVMYEGKHLKPLRKLAVLGIKVMLQMKFYRPLWTAGRYDVLSHSTICYNLLTGMSYFFEDISADVVGGILSVERNAEIDVVHICNKLDIITEELTGFFEQLVDIGLLTDRKYEDKDLREERQRILSLRLKDTSTIDTKIQRDENLADAEMDYLKRAHSKIFSLLIELTYNCSEKCIHCYNPGATRNDEEKNYRNDYGKLNLEDYKRIIDEFYELGLIRVTLSGGDPFSNPFVWEIMEYLYKRNIAFDVYTNGQNLVGKEEKLANLFPCAVGMSIYSDIPDVHDAITRVQGSFKKSISVVENLFNRSVSIGIKCCIMHQNCKSYRGVIKIAQRFCASIQIDCGIFDSLDGDLCVSRYLRLSPEELRIILRDKDLLTYVGEEIENFGKRDILLDRNVCSAGYFSYCLTPEGKLTYCPSFPSVIGDLKKQKLGEVLSNPSLKWWRELKWSDYNECGKEEYCKFCALCPGLNFVANGSPLKPSENNCYIARMRNDVFRMLLSGEDPLDGKTLEEALSSLPEFSPCQLKRVPSVSYYNKEIMGKGDSQI